MAALVVSTAPATQPITVDEVKQFARIDGTNAEPAPIAPTAALASPAVPGNVDNGAHRYLATFVTAAGETEAGTVSAPVTVADKTVNGQVQLSGIPLGGSAVTARKVYRTQAGGSTFLLAATIADNTTTTHTDNVADAGLGMGAPAVNTTDDPLLVMLIDAARAHAEQYLGRYLVTQTVDLYRDEFPGRELGVPGFGGWPGGSALYADPRRGNPFEIRLPPIQEVTEIRYTDADGTQDVLLAADQYQVDAHGTIARVAPAFGLCWPTTRCEQNAVRVRFVAGYGATSAVPMCIKHWMAMRISTLWNNRDVIMTSESRATQLVIPPDYVDGLLDPERVAGWR